jgi:cytochrome c553
MTRKHLMISVLAATAVACLSAQDLPQWAYGTAPAAAPAGGRGAPQDAAAQKTLAGSTLTFTLSQIRDGFGPADWFPGDHPQMPEIVAHGRRPDVRACALCHYPNGKGRAENAPISGLPIPYFIQQMTDFQKGLRKSADPKKANTNAMIAIAKAMTEAEIKDAAQYFGAMPWTAWIKVKEATEVPKTRVAGGLFLALDGGEKEPLAARIIEVPENTEATETLRDPRSGFIAYVPEGSIRRGEGMAKSCGVCHGADLKGLGPVPGIAGRSPSYLARQLYDFKKGARKGVWADLMNPVVAKLSDEAIVDLVAYSASIRP